MKNVLKQVQDFYQKEQETLERLNALWNYEEIKNEAQATYCRQLVGSLIRKQKLFKARPETDEEKFIHKTYLEIEVYKSKILKIKAKYDFGWITDQKEANEFKKLVTLIRMKNQEIDFIKANHKGSMNDSEFPF